MQGIRGMLLPLPTVFREDGSLDEALMRDLTAHYIGSGVQALFVGGSYGQGPALDTDERKRLAEVVLAEAKGRLPVVVHVGTADPYTTIELGRHALAAGAEALGVVGPYYYADRTPAEVRAHFRLLGRELQAPLLLYNNPKYSGYPMGPELVAQLVAESPQIFGAKIAMGTIDEALQYREAIGREFKPFALASSLYPGMLVGIAGTVSPPLTLCPELGVRLVAAIDEGDHAEALRLQVAVIEMHAALLDLMRRYGRGIYGAGLRELGFAVKQYPRWPVPEIPGEGIERLRVAMETARRAVRG